MGMGIRANTASITKLKDRIAALSNSSSIVVGFEGDAKYPNGKSVGEVARYMEYGTPTIPPRPFMRLAVDANRGKWISEVRDAILDSPDAGSLQRRLSKVGGEIVEAIQDSIDAVTVPPLAKSTIRARAARGNGSQKPLVDTGKMRDSVAFKIGDQGAWQKSKA